MLESTISYVHLSEAAPLRLVSAHHEPVNGVVNLLQYEDRTHPDPQPFGEDHALS